MSFKCTMSLLLVAILVSAPVQAQDEPPTYMTFSSQIVKRGKLAIYEKLIAERRDAVAEAGWPYLHVFQRVRGFNVDKDFVILYEDLDIGRTDLQDPEVSLNWEAGMAGVLESSVITTLEMPINMTSNTDRWLAKDADMLRLRRLTVGPGRAVDFSNWLANQLFPILRKAGVSMKAGRVILGGSDRSFVLMSVVDDWASFTAPNPTRESDKTKKMLAVGEQMVGGASEVIYRYRADLSFTTD